MDALTVALDSLYKAVALRDELQGPRVAKRIVLLSQLATQVHGSHGALGWVWGDGRAAVDGLVPVEDLEACHLLQTMPSNPPARPPPP